MTVPPGVEERVRGLARACVRSGLMSADEVHAEVAAAVRSGEPLTDVRLVGAGLTALLAPGQVAAPVRLADLAVTGLVRAGDRVDVLAATEGTPQAERVTAAALVLAAPGQAPDGLLLLAVDTATAARLAAASAAATVTVTLSAPGPAG